VFILYTVYTLGYYGCMLKPILIYRPFIEKLLQKNQSVGTVSGASFNNKVKVKVKVIVNFFTYRYQT